MYTKIFHVVSSLDVLRRNFAYIYQLHHSCYMSYLVLLYLISLVILYNNRAEWSIGKHLDTYSGGIHFECRPDNNFSCFSSALPGIFPDITAITSRPLPSKFFSKIIHEPSFQSTIYSLATVSIIENPTQRKKYISEEEYVLWSFSLCNHLCPPVSSFFRPKCFSDDSVCKHLHSMLFPNIYKISFTLIYSKSQITISTLYLLSLLSVSCANILLFDDVTNWNTGAISLGNRTPLN